jgi:hypothetical protein
VCRMWIEGARSLAGGRAVRTFDRMRLSFADLVLALLLVALAAAALPRCGERVAAPTLRASWKATPGALNPDVTAATIRSTICKHGWTRTVRPPVAYTSDLKRRQLRAFGLRGPPSAYQEDHLISLELGGHPTDPRNLWPEPYPRASAVDKLENDLRAKVCDGSLSLADAQRRESVLKHRDG